MISTETFLLSVMRNNYTLIFNYYRCECLYNLQILHLIIDKVLKNHCKLNNFYKKTSKNAHSRLINHEKLMNSKILNESNISINEKFREKLKHDKKEL